MQVSISRAEGVCRYGEAEKSTKKRDLAVSFLLIIIKQTVQMGWIFRFLWVKLYVDTARTKNRKGAHFNGYNNSAI
ncbi:MAG: hypothetical protein IJN34_02825 [Clostridia bacterium]|nr:hypothetical protein [Clostridia bacterium]